MFNNFINITTSRSLNDISEEERIMVEHIKSAISNVQNDLKNESLVSIGKNRDETLKMSGSFIGKKNEHFITEEDKFTVEECKPFPFMPDELVELYNR